MIIRSVQLDDFRNHIHTRYHAAEGVNILHGMNGAGKTSILEAIAIGAFTKSFLPTADAQLIRHGAESYTIQCYAQTDRGTETGIIINYGDSIRKSIRSQHGDSLQPKDVIGSLPMVILSPDFKSITFGAPQERRSFLDRLLSQCSRRYLEELTNHKRILKQRNNLLAPKNGMVDVAQLRIWTEQLVQCSAEIMIRRRNFLRDFTPYFLHAYRLLSSQQEQVAIHYEPNGFLPDDESWQSATDVTTYYVHHANQLHDEEIRRQTTLWGPQKDELRIEINSGVAKDVASQGQHKSLLISLKAAEFEYLKTIRNETPVLLLDDVFSELDIHRTEKVFSTIIAQAKQTFITTTEAERFTSHIPSSIPMSITEISGGGIATASSQRVSLSEPIAA
ncbi:MAG: DNA replication/repair protein RecF [Candidatus Kapabacteria bacterium]|nr:DNA replication/repair protein RecF [Candidatus Kapabacteria bacterium]